MQSSQRLGDILHLPRGIGPPFDLSAFRVEITPRPPFSSAPYYPLSIVQQIPSWICAGRIPQNLKAIAVILVHNLVAEFPDPAVDIPFEFMTRQGLGCLGHKPNRIWASRLGQLLLQQVFPPLKAARYVPVSQCSQAVIGRPKGSAFSLISFSPNPPKDVLGDSP